MEKKKTYCIAIKTITWGMDDNTPKLMIIMNKSHSCMVYFCGYCRNMNQAKNKGKVEVRVPGFCCDANLVILRA